MVFEKQNFAKQVGCILMQNKLTLCEAFANLTVLKNLFRKKFKPDSSANGINTLARGKGLGYLSPGSR